MAVNKKELDSLLADDKGLGFFVGLRFGQLHPVVASEVLTAGFADMSTGEIALVDAVMNMIAEDILEPAAV